MDRPMPAVAFRMMTFLFWIRDRWFSRADVLQEAEIRPGFQVLDYGCGPGAYVPGVAMRVEPSGRVYALDIHPLAVARVQALARRKGLDNVETICSDCQTGLADDSLDVVLLYDIFHMLSEPDAVLAELRRVLKPGGRLSLQDPHMRENDILARVAQSGSFELAHKGQKTYSFVPAQYPATQTLIS
jgi:ubiquinone/menaquinone biosynthesis C-methylase UbiE